MEARWRTGGRVAWLVGGALFAIYAATLTRGVGWDDSGELTAGVANLGVVHSHGYAPYVLLGHVFTLVEPFGSDATKVNMWSAVCAAGAVALVGRYVFVVTRSVAAVVVAALPLALGPVFWFHATVASTYPLTAFAIALLLNAADAWVRRPRPGSLALLAGSLGLVALSHWLGLAFAAGGVALLATRARGTIRGWRDAVALGAVFLPLATLLYIPLRAGYSGFPNRGGESLWDMLTGSGGTFAGDAPLSANRHGAASNAWAVAGLLLASLSPAALVLVPVGLRALVRERAYVVCCLAPAVVDSLIVASLKGAAAYWHIPLLVAGSILCGAGFERLRGAVRGGRAAAVGVAAALLVAPVCGAVFLAYANRSAGKWSRATLAALPPGARVVAPWTAYAPMRAEQELSGVRRDVRLTLARGPGLLDITTLRGGYVVSVAHDSPRVPGAVPVGPVAGATYKGLSGLRAGPFDVGTASTTARTYRLPDH